MKHMIGIYLNPLKVPGADWIFTDDPTGVLVRKVAQEDLGVTLPDSFQWHPFPRTVTFTIETEEFNNG